MSKGRLLHVLDIPPGYSPDNAAQTFSPNGDRFACATGTSAKMWEVESGKEIGSWPLPPGIGDGLAFDPTGKKLLLVRVETLKRKLPPLSHAPWEEHARVVRAYDLLGPLPTKEFVEIKEYKRHVWNLAVAPDAGYFVLEGLPTATDPLQREIKVFDGASGKTELLTFKAEVEAPHHHSGVSMDPTGKLLGLRISDKRGQWATLFTMPSGKVIKPLPEGTPSAGEKLWLREPHVSIYRNSDTAPLVTLDIDEMKSQVSFNLRGTQVAIGTKEGCVTVYDLLEIQQHLSTVGLGWE